MRVFAECDQLLKGAHGLRRIGCKSAAGFNPPPFTYMTCAAAILGEVRNERVGIAVFFAHLLAAQPSKRPTDLTALYHLIHRGVVNCP